MARYTGHSSYNNNNNISSSIGELRNAEKVADVNRNLTDLKSDILRLKILVQAMSEIMVEQGLNPDLLNAKIDEIMGRPETFLPSLKASMPCPKCGKNILDNGTVPLQGTCLYCGTVVKFPPYFESGEKKQEESN